MGALGDTEHSADGTENRVGGAFAICDGLEIVIVLLSAVEEFAVPHLVEGEAWDIQELDSRGTEEGKIFEDKGDGIRTRPKGVVDMSVLRMVVVAPFIFTETVVSTKEDPVAQCGLEAVEGGLGGAGDDLDHHRVVNHFPAVGDSFILPNRVRHKGDIVDRHTGAR